jgi:hypothetical protein
MFMFMFRFVFRFMFVVIDIEMKTDTALDFECWISVITIYAPVFYTAPCVKCKSRESRSRAHPK